MTTVTTRIEQIADVEGFFILVETLDSRRVRMSENGVLGPYGYDRRLKDSATVSDWIRDRFEQEYPGFTCEVLFADGDVAPRQTLLRTVRETYDETD